MDHEPPRPHSLLDEGRYRFLRSAAKLGTSVYALAFAWQSRRDRNVQRYASVVLYRTLGPRLPKGIDSVGQLVTSGVPGPP